MIRAMQKNISLLTLITFITSAWCAVPFYPYGPGEGDGRLPNTANPAVTLNLPESYGFNGEEFDHVCVSDNGYVTMNEPLRTNDPRPFPISSGSYSSRRARMIAPYWSDIDTRCGGDIFYRQVKLEVDDDLYSKIHFDVANSTEGAAFEPTSAVVVTWEGVTAQNKYPCRDLERNTFQFVLTTDGQRTFTMFRYKFLEWHTSSAGRGPATVGVNAGDFSNGFNLSNNPDDIIDLRLVSMSNVGIPGLFVYRTDRGPSLRVQTILMGKMMAMAAAETMEFGVAEAELYSPHADLPASEFNRQEQAHLEEYVGGLTATTENVDFYPFDSFDDSNLGISDEATSGKEYLEKPISFFGKNYSKIIVYTNGFLTLEDYYDFPAHIPRVLKTANVPIIAPFFADADTRGILSGKVYFRQTDDSSLLSRAKQDIEFTFSGVSFTPQLLYIATWDRIGFYNRHDNLLNSFQVILATDSHTTYAIFIYKQIDWTSPDSTGVSVGAGVGADPSLQPVMGISDGISIERLVTASEEPRGETKILTVDTDIGNTRIPGMWILEASTATHTTGTLQSSERRVDPKMQYTNTQRTSHPYVSAKEQMKNDVESLASELKNAKNFLG